VRQTRKIPIHRIKEAILLAIIAVASAGNLGSTDETCCPTRDLAMMPTPMPAGQAQDLTNLFEGAVLGPLIWDAIESIDAACPEISFYDLEAKAWAEDIVVKIDAAARRQKGWPPDPNPWKPSPPGKDMDYLLRGTLTANKVTGKDLSGNLEGTFTFHLALVDHHHKDAVVKEDSRTWTGGIMQGLDDVENMAGAFRPLPPLLKGYERIPMSSRVEKSDREVEAGQTESITVSELYDKEGQKTRYWQRLFVHVEKGNILNAEQVEEHEGQNYYIFRANEGTVNILYRAPDDCQKVHETLTVSNCCEKREPPCFMNLRPRTEIGRKEFDVVCDRWELKVAYHEEVAYDKKTVQSEEHTTLTIDEHIGGALDYEISAILNVAPWQPAAALRSYQGVKDARVKERANDIAGPGGMRYYIVQGVQAKIRDDFRHTLNEMIVSKTGTIERKKSWEWHADHQGLLPLGIRLKTYANGNSYDLTLTDHDPMDLGNPKSRHVFPVPWTYAAKETFNGQVLLNCFGTVEVKSPDNFPDNVFAKVPEARLAFDGTQRILSGEQAWEDTSSQLYVRGAETPGCKEHRALYGSGRVFPANSVKKTLTWSLRKLGR